MKVKGRGSAQGCPGTSEKELVDNCTLKCPLGMRSVPPRPWSEGREEGRCIQGPTLPHSAQSGL